MENVLISSLPIIFIICVWIVIIYRMRKFSKSNNFVNRQDEMIGLLKEIKDELKELNKNNSEKKL